ncbi:hypothetical protein CJ469_00098 [Nocardia farcinica]|nr:hypothetical protein CJ469_00098 [Nocardia farcinica]PFX09719.1 hypothetical protein CJ468_01559 [Nocardia farcinica]
MSGLSDRVCFYQPYAPDDATLAELVDHLVGADQAV